MQLSDLYQIYNPSKYKINIGGSCIGADGIAGTNWDLTYNEIRFMPPVGKFDVPIEDANAWQWVKGCIDRNIQFSLNPIQQISKDRYWLPGEPVYKQHIEDILVEILSYGGSKATKLCSLTVDNEPAKDGHQPDLLTYEKYIRWASQVAKFLGFKVTAGNEEFNLVYHRKVVNGWPDLYERMCQLVIEEVLDGISVHIQASCATEEQRKRWTEYCLNLKNKYQIKNWICTEANYSNPERDFYNIWVPQVKMALDIGCEAIGFVFIDYYGIVGGSGTTDYSWLAMFKNGELQVDKKIWLDLRELAIRYRKEIELIEYLRPEELQAVYDAFDIKTPYHWKTPNLYVVGEKEPAKTLTWADIDAITETQMKALIRGLKKLMILPENFPDYPDIKYNSDGSWNPSWEEYAKSNPKET